MQRARKSARQKARRLQYNGQEEHNGKHGDNDAGDIALGAIVENARLAIELLKGSLPFDGACPRPAARRSICATFTFGVVLPFFLGEAPLALFDCAVFFFEPSNGVLLQIPAFTMAI